MLSRVANSLYWAGRYVERSDHLARYLNVNYFSSLDAPNQMAQSRQFVLESILFMGGHPIDVNLSESEILYKVGFDRSNPQSILNCVVKTRSNAQRTRHLLSVEVWEAINKYYHFINTYSVDVFVTTGLYDLTMTLSEYVSIIREKIIRTLLHDEVWALLMLGIHIERAFQIVSLLNTKLYDIQKIGSQNPGTKDLTYEWATLLRCAEAYDMSKKLNKSLPEQWGTVEFLVLNPVNPKSLISNIQKVKGYIERIGNKQHYPEDSVEFKVGKLAANFQYLTMSEIKPDFPEFLKETYERLNEIGKSFEADYLFFASEPSHPNEQSAFQ